MNTSSINITLTIKTIKRVEHKLCKNFSDESKKEAPLSHCWVLQHPSKKKILMDQEREYAGGVLINSNTLWVAGKDNLKTFEFQFIGL